MRPNSHRKRNIGWKISFYLFISILCTKILYVNWTQLYFALEDSQYGCLAISKKALNRSVVNGFKELLKHNCCSEKLIYYCCRCRLDLSPSLSPAFYNWGDICWLVSFCRNKYCLVNNVYLWHLYLSFIFQQSIMV